MSELKKCLEDAQALVLRSFQQTNQNGFSQVAVASDGMVRTNFSVKAYHESLQQIQAALAVIEEIRRDHASTVQ